MSWDFYFQYFLQVNEIIEYILGTCILFYLYHLQINELFNSTIVYNAIYELTPEYYATIALKKLKNLLSQFSKVIPLWWMQKMRKFTRLHVPSKKNEYMGHTTRSCINFLILAPKVQSKKYASDSLDDAINTSLNKAWNPFIVLSVNNHISTKILF